MIEFIVGLVSMLVLVAFLIQLVTLAGAQRATMTEARRQAGRLALLSVGGPDRPDYIREWQPGSDQRTYSRDDEWNSANAGAFRQTFVDKAAATEADWEVMDSLPVNRVADLHAGTPPAGAFGLVSARITEKVPLLPAVRHLLFNRPNVDVETKVWMTETSGFY